MRLAAAAACAVLAAAGVAAAATISEPVALLQGLDKTSARISKFEAPVGKPVQFGDLWITVRDCEKNPPDEQPESAAFLEIAEARPGKERITVFSGWMFASSPALSAMEHPIYDVNVLECLGAPPPAAAQPPAAANPPAKSPR